MTTAPLTISLIAAATPSGVIGRDNQIPWKIREDLLLFKKITLGHPVIMGRKTFQSLGRPLPGRRNMVVSRNPEGFRKDLGDYPEVEVYPDLETAIAAAAGSPESGHPGGPEAAASQAAPFGEIFIIGGAQIYAQAMPLAGRLYISRVRKEYPGDTYFPAILPAEWEKVSAEPFGEFDLEIYSRVYRE